VVARCLKKRRISVLTAVDTPRPRTSGVVSVSKTTTLALPPERARRATQAMAPAPRRQSSMDDPAVEPGSEAPLHGVERQPDGLEVSFGAQREYRCSGRARTD